MRLRRPLVPAGERCKWRLPCAEAALGSRTCSTVVRVQMRAICPQPGSERGHHSPAGRSWLAFCCAVCGTAVAFFSLEVLFQNRCMCLWRSVKQKISGLMVAAAECLSRLCANRQAP